MTNNIVSKYKEHYFVDKNLNNQISNLNSEFDSYISQRNDNKVYIQNKINSYVGPQGTHGDPGDRGTQGNQGTASSVRGSQGHQGVQGDRGAQGLQGQQGNPGNKGNKGYAKDKKAILGNETKTLPIHKPLIMRILNWLDELK